MSWLDRFRRRRSAPPVLDELQNHIRERADDLVDAGVPETDARRQAHREFGNPLQYLEASRDVWRVGWLDDARRDLHYAMRTLGRLPGFTALALLTLALGIGSVTVVYSVINNVLWDPLPYPNTEVLQPVARPHQLAARRRGRQRNDSVHNQCLASGFCEHDVIVALQHD
jgi:hypothetical protein